MDIKVTISMKTKSLEIWWLHCEEQTKVVIQHEKVIPMKGSKEQDKSVSTVVSCGPGFLWIRN
jgi:hypothetical protein